MTSFTGPHTHISAYYTWSPNPISDDAPFPFIPMLWGCNSTYTLPFQQAVENEFDRVGLTADHAILAFNEPDLVGQAECTPSQAASAWMHYLEPLKGKFRLGSPAVTSGPGGKQWMLDWFQACGGGCNPDFIALHWYDIDPEIFIEHIRDFHDTWNLSIWITEYAVQNFSQDATQATLEEIETFMDVTTSYMQSVDWVERDFWFGAMYDMQGVNNLDCLFDLSSGNVTDRTGALSPLGIKYAGISEQVEVSIHSPAPDSWISWTNDQRSRWYLI
ncbi:hypothetical protein BCR39DRAFT_592001 [Naematelia encephala]|uniref:Asl1-like glycosyl hydrolase catalytic domain-containing protein n=1 Tax=Naematelia encephala TaxID=71784 RepID=A0A1Y2BLB5_9TREE|nr:hypothetical protein BCR39DRAFT_592001 [Naematelia encephala]